MNVEWGRGVDAQIGPSWNMIVMRLRTQINYQLIDACLILYFDLVSTFSSLDHTGTSRSFTSQIDATESFWKWIGIFFLLQKIDFQFKVEKTTWEGARRHKNSWNDTNWWFLYYQDAPRIPAVIYVLDGNLRILFQGSWVQPSSFKKTRCKKPLKRGIIWSRKATFESFLNLVFLKLYGRA